MALYLGNNLIAGFQGNIKGEDVENPSTAPTFSHTSGTSNLSSLKLNVLTEAQYEGATKVDNELYLTPDSGIRIPFGKSLPSSGEEGQLFILIEED